ncbi:MAG: hypothetical protein K9M96_14415 [Deltaproteobacteria bacterium]|nr:hypothetical protein [Deltaproteobacteria bacterium]
MWNQMRELMIGACDLHIHAGPDVVPRQQDLLEVAEQASEAGMKALAIKDHNTVTADRVNLAKKFVSKDLMLLGGIVLNYAVGGFNVEAVDQALRLGAKIVWMPSMDSCLTIEKVHVSQATPWLLPFVKLRQPEKGLTVLDQWPSGENLKPEVRDILKLIAENDAILDTCHLSAHECKVLIDGAVDVGVKKIIVTHPNCSVNPMTIDEQKSLITKGDQIYLNYAFLPCMPLFDRQHPRIIAEMMNGVGFDRCMLFSDFGQMVNPPPVEGYQMFIASLLAMGVGEKEIQKMASKNPARLLGLE